MPSKIYARAKRSFKLLNTNLFYDAPPLLESILICISHNVFVLYLDSASTYYFISIDHKEYEIVSILPSFVKLSINQLVKHIESLREVSIHGEREGY
jgi:hypothetical protein